jgi:hypothetical protein
MARASKLEREASKLGDVVDRVEAEFRERDEQLRSAEEEAAQENAESAAALGLGELTADEYEKRKRAAESRVEEARADRARQVRLDAVCRDDWSARSSRGRLHRLLS